MYIEVKELYRGVKSCIDAQKALSDAVHQWPTLGASLFEDLRPQWLCGARYKASETRRVRVSDV